MDTSRLFTYGFLNGYEQDPTVLNYLIDFLFSAFHIEHLDQLG